jgi:hypothetical protein
MLHPISFSIPREKIVSCVRPKLQTLATVIPGTAVDKEARKTHVFNEEKAYYEDYQKSLFGLTCKKGGWDCMRHYEILGNGCIPAFKDIDDCPANTMANFPKKLVAQGYALYKQIGQKQLAELTEQELRLCANLSSHLLDYTKTRLTTTAAAQDMLASLPGKCGSVLFLSGSVTADYLRCLTLHGLKTVLGPNCHDHPGIMHIYKSAQKIGKMYGKGFTYTRLLDPKYRDDARDKTIEHDIVHHRYDKIIYGSYHRGMPLIDLVLRHYAPHDVVLMCGEDLNRERQRGCCAKNHQSWTSKGHHVFVRELP